MKVRLGYATGIGSADPHELGRLATDLERLGFDSLWVPEILTGPIADPVAALGFVAGRVSKLKIGTHIMLAGCNVVRLARQLATLDRLSGGRLLVVGVTGLTTGPEKSARRSTDPGGDLEETLGVIRRLWSGETVTHEGAHHSLREVPAGVTPVQDPLEVWLGGMSDQLLDRCGRVGDGWLPGLCTPERGSEAIERINAAAASASRSIDVEHFGVNIGYSWDPLDAATTATLEARAKGQSVDELVPVGRDGLRRAIDRYVEHGMSKFVLRPVVPVADTVADLERLADAVVDMQT